MRRTIAIAAALAALAATPATARADGLPLLGDIDVGPGGVTAPGLQARYVALRIGDDTLVARTRRHGGQVLNSRRLPGRFTIPAVAYDGTPAGVSADGRTLVLIRPRPGFPQRHTKLRVLGTGALKLERALNLTGDFSFDALSPDGKRIYLIQYTSRIDPTHYRVRAYDVATSRLLPGAIVDPREPDEQMRGNPLTRATSTDGRWAYTLYDGNGSHPFVHALDTREGTAACIDLDALAGSPDVGRYKLAIGPDTLTVGGPDGPVALVDRTSFAVSEPARGTKVPGTSVPARPTGDDGGSSAPWLPLGAAAAVLALLATAARAGRRRTLAQ
jgi:hypothetical protein